ncbi:MAG: glycoside hydrolase, partial [Blastocatellia bacterium]
PLQLNLPPVSVRDLVIHDDDLVAATHGRGIWILDDIAALRQINDDVASSDAYLFSPPAAIAMPRGSDFGTPQPRDEALARNPPAGAMIDYYLKSSASGPVTLEILSPAGDVIRRYSSDDKPVAIDPDKIDIPASWLHAPEPLQASAGMHRWVWDLRPAPTGGGNRRGGGSLMAQFFGGGEPFVLPGTYTVKLTAGGKSYTRQLVVKRDPREK